MKKGFTLIELMIVIAIIAIIAAIAIPGLLAAQRASNERSASSSMKTLNTAEMDFRSNDRDGNRQQDFWTGDVYGLYGLIPVTGMDTTLPTDTTAANIIKLIEFSIAGADGQCLASTTAAVYAHPDFASNLINGSTKAGYIYRVMSVEDLGGGNSTILSGDATNDTDGAALLYGNVHHRQRYAFMAYPETMSSGKFLFIVSEDTTIWKYNLPATYVMTYTAISSSTGVSSCTSSATAFGTGAATSLNVVNTISTTTPIFPVSPGSLGFSKID